MKSRKHSLLYLSELETETHMAIAHNVQTFRSFEDVALYMPMNIIHLLKCASKWTILFYVVAAVAADSASVATTGAGACVLCMY